MLTDYLIVTASVTTLALIWRSILINHKDFAFQVKALPFIGESLYCGFCAPLWFSFLGVLLYNPLADWTPLIGSGTSEWLASLLVGWLTVGLGVLFARNGVAVLIELGGILSHRHHAQHTDEH